MVVSYNDRFIESRCSRFPTVSTHVFGEKKTLFFYQSSRRKSRCSGLSFLLTTWKTKVTKNINWQGNVMGNILMLTLWSICQDTVDLQNLWPHTPVWTASFNGNWQIGHCKSSSTAVTNSSSYPPTNSFARASTMFKFYNAFTLFLSCFISIFNQNITRSTASSLRAKLSAKLGSRGQLWCQSTVNFRAVEEFSCCTLGTEEEDQESWVISTTCCTLGTEEEDQESWVISTKNILQQIYKMKKFMCNTNVEKKHSCHIYWAENTSYCETFPWLTQTTDFVTD